MEAIIDKVIIKNYDSYMECFKDLSHQGCRSLGWLNSGITIPDGLNFEKAFSNRSGSSCAYVDVVHRVFYSVDMGD